MPQTGSVTSSEAGWCWSVSLSFLPMNWFCIFIEGVNYLLVDINTCQSKPLPDVLESSENLCGYKMHYDEKASSLT